MPFTIFTRPFISLPLPSFLLLFLALSSTFSASFQNFCLPFLSLSLSHNSSRFPRSLSISLYISQYLSFTYSHPCFLRCSSLSFLLCLSPFLFLLFSLKGSIYLSIYLFFASLLSESYSHRPSLSLLTSPSFFMYFLGVSPLSCFLSEFLIFISFFFRNALHSLPTFFSLCLFLRLSLLPHLSFCFFSSSLSLILLQFFLSFFLSFFCLSVCHKILPSNFS
ncbi:unnamed protein product [Acanthosepion pharaonis]|uniref:Uncharacterized protein n=1 Tax=Acanthosepion pharaonis TaxID=158019 RepID=A0A812DHF3_ACAPH|nr:unnamed protein product [Sepia pharaonis]